MKFDNFINESFTAKQVQDIQYTGIRKPSCDVIFDMHDNDTFEEVEIAIKDILAPKGLTLSFYKRKGMDEDISIVNRIIKAYLNRETVPPFVVDENLKIMDGLHRYVAALEAFGKNGKIKVLKRI